MTEYNAKIQEIEDRLAAAEDELRALKAEKDKDDLPAPPHPRWKPEIEEMYYAIDGRGHVAALHWDGVEFDLHHFDIGNMLKRDDDATFALKRQKVLAEMREWAGKWSDPYRIINIDGRVEPETVYVGRCISYGEIRFATEADAKNCINSVGEDRLKKYYFGIPGDNGCCTSER